MIIATPASLTGERKPKSAGILLQSALTVYPVGGLIFDGGNISSGDQLKKFLTDAQGYSQIPLFLTLDEEGGRVTRLQNTVGTTQIGPMYDYHELGTGVAYTNAMVIAADIKSYGFNMDLAPVADVWSNPENTVIGDRAYSTDYIEASELVSAAVQGFHSQGIPCCLKHFPGHGDSSEDSHYGAVYIYKSLADIKAEECLPFASGINAGADCVMMGHLIISELGDDPALFSKTLIRDILRGELGFKGIVMTDSLQMKAMTDYYGVSDIAVRSVDAGCDILLMPSDVPFTVKAIEDAVSAGVITESRIDESVRRIISLKVKYGIMQL
ncbi:MAG: glycoside hydrolase family 3 protein [Lachnospiraceae bacterium]|nr:glycoside hydrolase family 3 protein [Lachnospiraceae bacterium]